MNKIHDLLKLNEHGLWVYGVANGVLRIQKIHRCEGYGEGKMLLYKKGGELQEYLQWLGHPSDHDSMNTRII
jgi:hypothetical protein